MHILLRGIRWHSEGSDREGDLRVARGRIAETGRGLRVGRRERVVDGAGLLALPGLINGHDHLGLDLFPRLGSPPYPDFYAWGREIHRPERSPLREILRVRPVDRLRWGGYRNLVGGVTTVMHHDPFHPRVFTRRFPVRVVRRYGWAHSLGHEPDVAGAFGRARGRPFVIHAMEGTSRAAEEELDRLEALGVLAPNTVIVHAVALRGPRLDRLATAGAGIVWCPASNRFLYDATLPVAEVKDRVPLCLGTDSTLSGSATLLDECREAARGGGVSPAEILELVTTRAAAVFRLADGRGTLRRGAPADLVLVPDTGGEAGEALLAARPQDLALVMVRGRAGMAAPSAAESLGLGAPNARVAGRPRWLRGRPGRLRARVIAAAGEEVLRANPVWTLLDPTAAPEAPVEPETAPETEPAPELVRGTSRERVPAARPARPASAPTSNAAGAP